MQVTEGITMLRFGQAIECDLSGPEFGCVDIAVVHSGVKVGKHEAY